MAKLSLISVLENAAAKAKDSGSMIAFFIPQDVASQIQKMFGNIDGDMVEPKDMHITLGLVHNYSGNEKKISTILDKFCARHKPFSVSVRSFATFPPNEHNEHKHILYAEPEADEIYDIRNHLFSVMKKYGINIDNGGHNEYKPHITIKYCDEQPDVNKQEQFSFGLDKLSFAVGDKRHSERLG